MREILVKPRTMCVFYSIGTRFALTSSYNQGGVFIFHSAIHYDVYCNLSLTACSRKNKNW